MIASIALFDHDCPPFYAAHRVASVDCPRSVRVTPSFSLYDKQVVSEEQIQKWADEAEAGYDVEELKRRGRGVPVVGLNRCRSWRSG